MSNRANLTYAIAAAALFATVATPVLAQGGRLARQRQAQQEFVPPTPEEALAPATAAAASAGLPCAVTSARWVSMGSVPTLATAGLPADQRVTEDATLYEVACQTGPGFLLVQRPASASAENCLLLQPPATPAVDADGEPVPDNPYAPVCRLPGSGDPVQAVRGVAAAGGLDCQIDQAALLGNTAATTERYEVGCDGRAGAWVEVTDYALTPSRVVPCHVVAAAGGTCNFTTQQETAATIGAFAATGTRSCDAANARYAGRNADGEYFEVSCQDGSGFMFLYNDNVASRSWECAEASHVAGGCRLTASAPTSGAVSQD